MAYEAVDIVVGSVIEASWGDKIESHLERLGAYRGVVASAANLPDVSTLDEGDWFILKTEQEIRMCISGAYVTLKFPPTYEVATQAEAEAGTSDVKYMTPLKTAQAIAALESVSSVNGETGAVSLSAADVGAAASNDDGLTTISDTAPSAPVEGKLWYDKSENKLKSYDGANWNKLDGRLTDISGYTLDDLYDSIADLPIELWLPLLSSASGAAHIFNASTRRAVIYNSPLLISSVLFCDEIKEVYKSNSTARGEVFNNASRVKHWINYLDLFWRSSNSGTTGLLQLWLDSMTKYGSVAVDYISAPSRPVRYGFLIPNSTTSTYNYFRISTWDLTNINTLTCRVKLTAHASNSYNSSKITVNGTTVWYANNNNGGDFDGPDGAVISIDLSGYTGVQYLSFETRAQFSLFVTEIAIS